MYVFHCLQWFCTTGGVEQRTATAPWIQYTPCLGLEMVAFILARLWIGCLLAAPSCQEISWPVCMIRTPMLHCPPAVWFASTVGCGSGAHCPLLKHSPSAARGTFTVVILCSGFLFTERRYRARFGNISLSSLPVCLSFSCTHALHCPWRSRLCLPLRCAALQWHPGCVGALQCHGFCCVLHATYRHSQMFMW